MDSSELQQLVVDILEKETAIPDTRKLVIPGTKRQAASAEDQNAVISALASLASREIVTYDQKDAFTYLLTAEGAQIARDGSHEALVWAAVPPKDSGETMTIKQLQESLGQAAKIGQGKAFKNGWVGKDRDKLFKLVAKIVDTTREELNEVEKTGTLKGGEKAVAELRKRKLLDQKKSLWCTVKKGPAFTTDLRKPETDLTAEMLATGSWKDSTFKKYNFDADGTPTNGGALHPLMKVREEVRGIFFEMGFAEMPTDAFVESCFWNFDALYVPQQHPARETQDTFYVSSPLRGLSPPKDYLDSVAQYHSRGSSDGSSRGYQAPFSKEESHRLLLRTHTTSCSARMLYALAQKGKKDGFKPAKLFSIDRVFRNEAVDATHLAEFHQVEGVVADRGLTLGDLIGFMQTFFAKMGLPNLRFKPAYNPYTEPSLEIFCWHPGLGKWVEIGNSGMFRPEMLEPMGFPPDVRVHGWGLGLERPTMIRYGITNIRSLVGHKVSIDGVEKSPAVRF
ncbi:hypothetical protein DACRYDRAFT_60848 [Dacryopinax primogenitus]|uniref:phenylalanine--tRNA ligase n=1 Tax=Dacryopinax primogenitus (strain DJM 731) TaxID=1858805 RepID=M5G7P6_DACPD|nr:uncharacterized protein DACRYDRAFT_60848 [Dacryopinax primogenitus]EJU06216.1 hypothetical protein DACRYDRAFT_60848 [Dacryopinax primogenitus]